MKQFLLPIGLLIFVIMILSYTTNWIFRRRFKHRREVSEFEVCKWYASSPCEDVIKYWKSIGLGLGISWRVLRPSDRFDSELKPVKGFEFEDDSLNVMDLIAEVAEERGIIPNTINVNTLDDVMKFLLAIK